MYTASYKHHDGTHPLLLIGNVKRESFITLLIHTRSEDSTADAQQHHLRRDKPTLVMIGALGLLPSSSWLTPCAHLEEGGSNFKAPSNHGLLHSVGLHSFSNLGVKEWPLRALLFIHALACCALGHLLLCS